MKVKLGFMEKPVEINPETAKMQEPGIIAVYAQNDTWDVHVFFLFGSASEEGERFGMKYEVWMCDFRKEEKSQEEFDIDELEEILCDGPTDSGDYKSLESAIEGIMG